jgi:type I restriction enzyme M protein
MRGEHFDHVREWWKDRKEIELPDGPKAKRYSVDELVARGFNLDLCGYPHEEEVILPPDELIRNYREERARLDAEIDEKLARICEILGIQEV